MAKEIGSTSNGMDYVKQEFDLSWSSSQIEQCFKGIHSFRPEDTLVYFTEGHD